MVRVRLIFRKQNPLYFSIEKVFKTIIPFFPGNILINEAFVKSERANMLAVLQNLFRGRQHADIYHVTGDIHYMSLAFPKKKTILTIHDCIFMKNISGFKHFIMQWLWLKLPVMKSEVVTVISEASKQDVLNYTGCDPQKILVIPDPVSEKFKYSPHTFKKIRPRILQVGTWPNKNLERVAAALKNIPCDLVIIGKLSDPQKAELSSNSINYLNLWNLSEEELIQEYEKSDLLIFATTFEGFGLPIIEAQSIGRLVITSNLLPMSEVAGGASILVDPFDVESIRKGICQAINNDNAREILIRKGLDNVKRYHPSFIAAEYSKLYETIFEKNTGYH